MKSNRALSKSKSKGKKMPPWMKESGGDKDSKDLLPRQGGKGKKSKKNRALALAAARKRKKG